MGVDATVFVIAGYSPSHLAFGDACIELCRQYEDWEILYSLSPSGRVSMLQVMRGSDSAFADGKRPEDEDRESGYLFGDSYTPGNGFAVYDVASLASVLPKFTEVNRRIFGFILAAYPHQKFLIIWH